MKSKEKKIIGISFFILVMVNGSIKPMEYIN